MAGDRSAIEVLRAMGPGRAPSGGQTCSTWPTRRRWCSKCAVSDCRWHFCMFDGPGTRRHHVGMAGAGRVVQAITRCGGIADTSMLIRLARRQSTRRSSRDRRARCTRPLRVADRRVCASRGQPAHGRGVAHECGGLLGLGDEGGSAAADGDRATLAAGACAGAGRRRRVLADARLRTGRGRHRDLAGADRRRLRPPGCPSTRRSRSPTRL